MVQQDEEVPNLLSSSKVYSEEEVKEMKELLWEKLQELGKKHMIQFTGEISVLFDQLNRGNIINSEQYNEIRKIMNDI